MSQICYICVQKRDMAKLSSASIRLVLKKNRINSSGDYPIYVVVCFKGRKEKATGISCPLKYWDEKREEIKKGYPNAPIVNKMLSDIKQRIVDRKNSYELNGRVYTPSILLEDSVNDYNGSNNKFKCLMDSLCHERRLKYKTVDKYRYTYKKISEFFRRDDFIINELNVGFLKDFSRWLNVSDNSKRNIFGVIASIWNYSIDKGIVENKDYPFREFKFTRKFKETGRDYFIDRINMKKLKEYFLDLCVERNGDLWCYRDGIEEKLMKRTSKEFGILFFLVMYHFNGSAPIDIARLMVSDVERILIEGEDYYSINFKRLKSGTQVNVRLKRNVFSIICLEHFIMKSKGYIYPIIKDSAETDIQIIRCSNKASESAIKWVREAFKEINEKTIQSNVLTGKEEPLVDVDKVVMYTARHSFASNYLNSPGATVIGAASLLSRSANTISTYIHQLQGNKEIASAVEFLED